MPQTARANTGPRPTPKSPTPLSPPTRLKSPGLKSPRPTDLFIKKSFVGNNGSSTSINEMPPPPTPTGLRAQLGHLLPRHSYFRTRVVIHQISSVPFVGGEFAVRWKFKGVQSTPGSKQKLLGKAKSRIEGDDLRSPEDGFLSPPGFCPTTSPSLRQNAPDSLSSTLTDSGHLTTEWGQLSVAATATSSASSLSTTIPATNVSGVNTPVSLDITPARGMTPFLHLKDHSVSWSQSLDTILKFDIDRETSQILQNPLKLVVIQRVIPGDPHGNPQNPRLGAVYLNLSEYVGEGSVTRRYLLKESKTNAVLKLTIQLEYHSGESHYIPPPLAKGEILTGIAGYLEDSVKKRPRPLDLFDPYENQEELKTDLLSTTKRVPTKPTRKVSDGTSHITIETETEDDEYHETTSFEENEPREDVEVAFDVRRLPAAYGTKTTEMLIDSLFNPARVSDKAEENPFTIYDPLTPSPPKVDATYRRGGVGLGLATLPHDLNKTLVLPSRHSSLAESSSMTTTTSDSASELSHTSSSLQSRSLVNGRFRTRKVVQNDRSTPEGRVIVEGPHSDMEAVSEDSNSSSVGVVRGWWRRNMSKHNMAISNQAS